MTIGIIPNISKSDILDIVKKIIVQLQQNEFGFILSDSLVKFRNELDNTAKFQSHADLSKNSDMVVSIGGDGTMLNTAFEVKNSSTPIIGVNFGKLGFLAEFDLAFRLFHLY